MGHGQEAVLRISVNLSVAPEGVELATHSCESLSHHHQPQVSFNVKPGGHGLLPLDDIKREIGNRRVSSVLVG